MASVSRSASPASPRSAVGLDRANPASTGGQQDCRPIARLIHLNGPPAVGKSSLARRYLVDHPWALMVDIDGLRTQLGQWDRIEQTRTTARHLALVLAEAHLSAGHDVVVPQYVGRIEFIEQLAGLAARCDAAFLEVVLVAETNVSIERFRSRRDELRSAGVSHPEADVDTARIDDVVADASDRLSDICDRWVAVRRVNADADLAATYRNLLEAVGDGSR